VIAIVPAMGSMAGKVNALYTRFVRLDVLTPSYNLYAQHATNSIPGVVLVFTRYNLLKQLKFLVAERAIYQNYMRARAQGIGTAWRPLPAPCCSDDKGRHFAPILPSSRQPFVLDAKPSGRSESAVIQITAKMVLFKEGKHVTVVRVFNRRFALSDNPEEVAASVNPRALIWLWLTRTLDESVRHVLAGLFRATAAVVSHLPRDSLKAAELTRSCCALKFFDLASDNDLERLEGRYALCLSPPSQIALAPEYSPEDKVAVCANVVYTDSEANDAALKAYYGITVGAKLRTPIPEWCVAPDGKSLEFLTSLMT
jgi:hypothetical protein